MLPYFQFLRRVCVELVIFLQYRHSLAGRLWLRVSHKYTPWWAMAAVLQGSTGGKSASKCIHTALSRTQDLFWSSLTWLLISLRSLMATDWKHQLLAMWASPQGSSQNGRWHPSQWVSERVRGIQVGSHSLFVTLSQVTNKQISQSSP